MRIEDLLIDVGPPSPRSEGPAPSAREAEGSRSPRRAEPFGFRSGATGGYFGTEGQGDWAMEREMEIQRLQEENRVLREMLGINREAEEEEKEEIEEDKEEEEELASKRRMSSLTAEDLEADSEKERLKELETVQEPREERELSAELIGLRANASVAPEDVFDETDGEVAEAPSGAK